MTLTRYSSIFGTAHLSILRTRPWHSLNTPRPALSQSAGSGLTHRTRKPYSITSSARASSVGGISNLRAGCGATADENGHYPFAVALLAERGARGLDVVQALGPILLYHLGLGVAERLAQCDEHRRRMFLLEFRLDHRDALVAIGFVVQILSAFDVLSQCAIEWCVVFIFFRIKLMTSFRSCLCVVSCTIFCIASPGYRLNQHVRDVAAPFHVQH
jgi:hypothetical protein